MTKKSKTLLYVYIFLALLGLIDAAYLTYTRFLGITPPCSVGMFSDCATVAKSSYSVLFGVPLSVYGIIFYAFEALTAIYILMRGFRPLALNILFYCSMLGALSSAYFLYVQGSLIGAYCIYCVTSALISFILFALYLIFLRNNKMQA